MSLEKEGFEKLKIPEEHAVEEQHCLQPQRSAEQISDCRCPLLAGLLPLDQQIASDEFWQEL